MVYYTKNDYLSEEIPFQRVLRLISQKSKVRPIPYRNGFRLCCTAHNDRNPSLIIFEGDDGCVLLKCFAGCSADDICAAIGLTLRDLFSRRSRGKYRG